VGGGVVVGQAQGHLVGQAADAGGLLGVQVARRMRQHRPVADQAGALAGEHHLQVGRLGERTRRVSQGALERFGRAFGLGGHVSGLPRQGGEHKAQKGLTKGNGAHQGRVCVIQARDGRASAFEEKTMLKWAIILAVVALIAGALGFGGIAGAAAGIAKILFFLFLIGCIIFFVLGLTVFKSVTRD
jgi:uncharacterized membrane protein YtjA (UPF0391 family)